LGVTLLSIPFWWDKSPRSLASAIQYYRPDINIPGLSVPPSPLPSEIPQKYRKPFLYVPNASKELDSQVDPTNWYLSVIITCTYSSQVDNGKV
jgi:hypothetical protein